jgi:hypothetical protein
MPKDDNDNNDRGTNFSDTSSSVATVEYDEEEQKRRERRRKKSKKSSHRRDDESDSDEHERRHRHHSSSKSDKKKKRHKKSSKRKKDHRKRQKKHDEDSSYESRSDDENDSEYSRRRRHKHSRKERKRRRKGDTNDDGDTKKKSKGVPNDSASENTSSGSERGQIIAKALHDLLTDKPDFASELPLVLIRLAGGTTFDLRQVTDPGIAKGLQAVFEALQTFGVQKQESSGMWMFQNPPGASRRDELVLLRVVRSFLDDVGLTMEKLVNFDEKQRSKKNQPQPEVESNETILEQEERQKMKELTFKILEKFRSKDATLGSQLASLCMTIVDGESVSVDGIPDDDLKAALESLFQTCGLEKSEIEEDEEDDDDDDESDESPLMGYGLSASGDANNDVVQMRLATIMAACREGPPKRKSVGPMRRPTTEEEEQAANAIYGANNAKKAEDEAEDEGPLLPGEARKARGPAMSLETIKAQAEYRELELKSTSAGVPMPSENGGREEWMINPGEHTFLDGIKSGTTIKSRGFQNKKSRGGEDTPQVHPAVQAEMDAIMHAHENARGPSLMDIYQSKKAQEKELASSAGDGKNEFKWSRDNDLDAGRRVDKNALGMILGGAADNLKTKFAGGFNR